MKNKVHVVMGEFKRKKLKSGSGKKVTNRKQAIAIALSEAGLSKKNKRGESINQFMARRNKRRRYDA